MNGPQALYVNPGCLKYISGINLSLNNKSLFTIAFMLYFYVNVFNMETSLKTGTFDPNKLL